MTQSRILLENIAKDFDAIFETSRYRNIIVDVMQNFFNATMNLISSDKKSKYSVIQHGDLWTNNIMFQIQDNQPSMCTFIDYQLSRDSLPVSDIIYFVFNCTDYKTRLNHYHKWIDFYHSELDRHLSYFDLKVEDVYPRQKFDADLKRYAKAGLGMTFFVLNFSLRSSQEAPDLVMEDIDGVKQIPQFKMGALTDKTLKIINERVEGVIESCLEYGYLTNM